tara:strand:- start:1004 stop:1354 length:351 start_codon:yes stop_codon:yes gene_type:complete
MRTIIAGGRDFKNYELLDAEVSSFFSVMTSEATIISGGARGADDLGEDYAVENELRVVTFPADWGKYGKSAGYRRNAEMADYSEALIAFWDGKSKGTKHMIDLALSKGLLVKVVKY